MREQEILRRLGKIEARARKATPGTWMWYKENGHIRRLDDVLDGLTVLMAEDGEILISGDDAEFIAHSREDVLWLCQLVKDLLIVVEAGWDLLQSSPEAYEDIIYGALGWRRPEDSPWLKLSRALAVLKERKEVRDNA